MKLGDLADVRMGYPFRLRLEHDPEGAVVVIQMKDIDETNFLHAQQAIRVQLPKGKARHLLQPGDLLFRSRGRSNGAALVREGLGLAVLSAPMLLIRPLRVLPEYLCWYMNAPNTQAKLAALAEGTSVLMISAETLKAVDVPLPSRDTQQGIAQAAALAAQEQELRVRIAHKRQRVTTHLLMRHAHRNARQATQ